MPTKFSFSCPRSTIVTISFGYKHLWLDLLKKEVIKRCCMPVTLFLTFGLLVMALFPVDVIAGPSAQSKPAPLVTVATVTVQDVNPPAEYVGHVEALQSVDLRARVEGFLEQVNFKEGSDVNAGDLLYVLEQAPYKARVDADRARVAQTQAILTKARQYLERIQTVRSGGVSATDIDNAVAEELRSKAEFQEAQATLKQSELDLKYTTITAPIRGRIGKTAFTKGNLVGPDSGTLARIVQLDPIRVVYSISENDLPAINMAFKDADKDKNHPMLMPRIKLAGGQSFKPAGHVDFVDNTVDASTGTIAVRALFNNPEGTLIPGQYVTILVARKDPKPMTVVPQKAVLEDHDGRYVLLVDDRNRVVVRRVKTGPVVGINWAVESGLSVNESVIVEGVQKVRPGQVVKSTGADEHQGR